MRRFRKTVGSMVIVMLVLMANQPTAFGAQDGRHGGEAGARQAILTPEQISALDMKLAHALKLYYDGKYDEALPMFTQIAQQLETVDLAVFEGKCAARAGDIERSIRIFQQLLSEDPNRHRARLELADTLYQADRFAEARGELKKIESASPPKSMINEVNTRLERIEQQRQVFRWTLFFTQGLQYDDNVSAGPDQALIETSLGVLSLDENQRETDSANWLSSLNAYMRYDMAERGGAFWDGGLDFFFSKSFEDSDFDYLSVDVSTGPGWMWGKSMTRLLAGYTDTTYGQDHLSGIVYVKPDVEFFFTDTFSVEASYTVSDHDYSQSEYRDYDATSHQASLGHNLYLDNARHIISAFLSLESRDADTDRTSFDAIAFTVSYFTRFRSNTELLIEYEWRAREYDDPPEFYTVDREDTRNTFNVIISQKLNDLFFVSVEFLYIDNNSNADLFDYEKTSFGVKLGIVY